MKVLLCGKCFDIRAFDPDGKMTSCRCGNVSARWIDPARGTVAVSAIDRSKARIIGMHNGMLQAAFAPTRDLMIEFGDGTSFTWDQVHKRICQEAKGYVFHESIRNCWACVVEVGQTSDIRWEDPGETKIVQRDSGGNNPDKERITKTDKEVSEGGGEGHSKEPGQA